MDFERKYHESNNEIVGKNTISYKDLDYNEKDDNNWENEYVS